MTKRPTDGIRRLCGIVEGMRDNEFAEATVRKAAVAEECDRLDGAVEAVRQDAWDEGFEAGREWSIEDRNAIAWVREHGGLYQVKIDYDVYEGFSVLVDRIAARLGVSVEGLDDQDAEPIVTSALDRRLMPGGMEWPRYDTGEPVRIGDVAVLADNEPHEVESMEFFADKSCKLKGKGTPWMDTIFKGQVAKRPAPKVLDADGVEIRAKETVFDKNTGEELIVTGFEDGRVWCEHRMTDADALPVRGMWSPGLLTHERPESKCRDCAHWQKDPTADNMGVCWFFYHEHEGQDCYPARLGDIGACEEFMPRTRALAERERGE